MSRIWLRKRYNRAGIHKMSFATVGQWICSAYKWQLLSACVTLYISSCGTIGIKYACIHNSLIDVSRDIDRPDRLWYTYYFSGFLPRLSEYVCIIYIYIYMCVCGCIFATMCANLPWLGMAQLPINMVIGIPGWFNSKPSPVLPKPGITVRLWEIIPIHGPTIQVSEIL